MSADRGPSAAVRANVMAAAREVAAEAAARVAAEQAATVPLTPVAPPVAEVGRGRARAVNLSSWRVRSGAAFCAMLLVGVALWRLDAGGRFSGGVQVALAELKLAEPAAAPMPHDLPMPAAAAASYPYAAPPPVIEDAPNNVASTSNAAAKQIGRDRPEVVAQADQAAARSLRAAPLSESVAESRKAAPAQAGAPADAPKPIAAPPAVASDKADRTDVAAAPTQQEPTLVTVTGAPVQLSTAPAMPPSVLQRRIVVAQAPAAPVAAAPAAPVAPPVMTAAAAPPQAEANDAGRQRVEVTGGPAGLVGDASRKSKSAPAALGSLVSASARVLPSPLHVAAERGDVDSLKKLLADPQAQVDAPDAGGRTALLRAVLAQQPAAVRLLLAAGADPARADPAGLTPRAAAQAGASAEIAALLGSPR